MFLAFQNSLSERLEPWHGGVGSEVLGGWFGDAKLTLVHYITGPQIQLNS